ncbi:hypothetical protein CAUPRSCDRAFT_12963 [Caulochytrium protostelioides]|uniref:Uncharacterized protein n=1 Tax=Caulochytrium protostelioides TaxID=1555241 RepID=A0A4P9WVB2_9FUNG|nr:hypothetical protein CAUPRSCDRAFT_12963 [Caulochytrium protostelioides]
MAKAKSCGITAPLAIGQVWDTTIQLGPEAADELIKKADAKLAAEGKSNTDQVAWLEAYMDARDEKVKGMPAPYPITVYRQTAFRHMLKVSKIDFTNTLETLQNSSDVPIKITCDGLSV